MTTTAGELAYDGLVLATGARAQLPEPLRGPDTHVLRTLEDALRLRAALVPGARVVVVGAGWIGAEVGHRGGRRRLPDHRGGGGGSAAARAPSAPSAR